MRNIAIPLLATICVAGCGEFEPNETSAVGWQVDDLEATSAYQPGVVELPAPTRFDCELEHAAFRETWWVEPRLTAFTPGDGLLVTGNGFSGGSGTLSVDGGDFYETNTHPGLLAVDRAWEVGVFLGTAASVRRLDSGQVLAEATTAVVDAAISSDARLAAFASCVEGGTQVELVSMDGEPTKIALIREDTPCYQYGPGLTVTGFTDDNRYLAVATASGSLWSFDIESWDGDHVVAHPQSEEAPWVTTMSDLAVRPGTHEVVTTGADGVMRTWALDSLELLDERAVGAFPINASTYAPRYTVSPVAFTSDGQSLAFVNSDGDVVISNDAGETVLPTPIPRDIELDHRTSNVPVTLAFGGANDRLGVGYYWGPATWGCPGRSLERAGELTLGLPAQRRVQVGSEARIPIELHGRGPLAGLRFDVNGAPIGVSVEGSELRLWGGTAGEFTLSVEADDGFARAQHSVRLTFTGQ